MNVLYSRPMRPIRTQTITVGAASAAITNPVGEHIHVVRIVIDGTNAAHIAIGPGTPTAVATDMLVQNEQPGEYFAIHPGEKVAAIQEVGGSTAYVTEMSA